MRYEFSLKWKIDPQPMKGARTVYEAAVSLPLRSKQSTSVAE